MKLYYAETLNPRKACAVARYLDAPVEFVHVDLRTGEQRQPPFLSINPNGKVPVLEDGEKRIWEANAIMGYLARAAGSDLWPQRRPADRSAALAELGRTPFHAARRHALFRIHHQADLRHGPAERSRDEGSDELTSCSTAIS